MDLDHDTCFRIISARDARYDGRFFTAVKTTGIYCRPVCPARVPRRENVQFFATAPAAQEAGFRPCLRCRPETAPDTPAWRGTSSTIGRALRLIEEGALDTGSVEALASRLGVGGRHLRRLFLKHVGASPVSVAVTRRVLLAKHLLHETELSITQVALASGFSSIRRFNEAFLDVFKQPPSLLRREIGAVTGGQAGAELRLRLRYRPPYDWHAMSSFLATRAYHGVEVVNGGTYRRSFCVDGRIGLLGISPGSGNWLDVDVKVEDVSILPRIIARVRESFDLAADPDVIAAHLGSDRDLQAVIMRRPGLRVPGAFEPFEVAVRAILGQQVTVGAAIKLGCQLVAHLGDPLPPGWGEAFGVTRLFPTASAIAGSDLGFLGMPRARVACLKAFCAAYLSAPDFFGDDGEVVLERLRAIPGIGSWTASYIALRALRNPDAFPAEDVALARGLTGPDGIRPSKEVVEARAQSWRPWRAYAAQHIWTELAAA